MPNIEDAIQYMYHAADSDELGYSQADRQNFGNPGNCDCSSLVTHALQVGGFDTGDATYTGNLSSNLCDRGWTRLENDGNPQDGDILLNDADHVAMMLHNGDLGQASISENGTVDGEPGDQTGQEVNTRPYYDYPWDCYLRYGDGGGQSQPSEPAQDSDLHIHLQACSESQGVLEAVTDNADNAGDGSPIIYLAAWADTDTLKVQANDLDPLDNPSDINDTENGAVGDGGYMTKLRMQYFSDGHYVAYRVMVNGEWLDWMHDLTDTGDSGDDFAGNGCDPITRVEAYLV